MMTTLMPDNSAEKSMPNLVFLHTDQWQKSYGDLPHFQTFFCRLHSIRYCHAEAFHHCIFGTLRIPQKSEHRQPKHSFGFYMTDTTLFIIDDTDEVKKQIHKNTDLFQDCTSPDQLLLLLIEQFIENDIPYLLHFETEIEEMETTLVSGISEDFFAKLTKYRQKFTELNAYYEQLTAFGDLIQTCGATPLVADAASWNRLTQRTERLQNHVRLLQENTLQLRELYQSIQDAWQNKVMCILTVVTTLLLPLTLLTGWYGMNFVNMPELHWKYGYLAVAIVAGLIILLEIIYFKKKKFF